MTNPFPPNLTLLSATMPIAAIIRLDQAVFLPVQQIDHLGVSWQQYRLMARYTLHSPGGQDVVTIEFVDDVPDQDYVAGQEVQVLLGAFH
jgi:hypothetical protein